MREIFLFNSGTVRMYLMRLRTSCSESCDRPRVILSEKIPFSLLMYFTRFWKSLNVLRMLFRLRPGFFLELELNHVHFVVVVGLDVVFLVDQELVQFLEDLLALLHELLGSFHELLEELFHCEDFQDSHLDLASAFEQIYSAFFRLHLL